MSKPKSKKEAELIGSATYFTGLPCKRGGIADRRLNGDCLCGACVDFARLVKRKYFVLNREKNESWRKANPEKMAEYKRVWHEKNKNKAAESLKKWKSKNKDKVLAETHKRIAAKKKAIPAWYGEFDDLVIGEALSLAKLRESVTKVKWHMDHMIPLRSKVASGLHCAMNVQVIPEKLNCVKRNSMLYTKPFEWVAAL